MFDLFFSNNAGWFTLPAFVGTFFFLLRMVLMMSGADGDSGGDFDADIDAPDGDVHGDPGDAFKVLSIQTIATFLMGFGWAGLGAYKGSGLEWPLSLFIATVGGVGLAWLMMLLLKFVYSLQSSGNINVSDAQGAEGVVYVGIPGQGKRGQVRLVVSGRQRLFNAFSEDDGTIESKRRVKVVKVNRDNTITVRAI
ncbi:MAG: hypothetical protein O7G85_09660 [Planctomycetota bacterium]|nr:hypothetical protein [Planctomycetota bacterium]